jgi:hypothetical protein
VLVPELVPELVLVLVNSEPADDAAALAAPIVVVVYMPWPSSPPGATTRSAAP